MSSFVKLLDIISPAATQTIQDQTNALSLHLTKIDTKHTKTSKLVIVTRGALPVICCENGAITSYPVTPVSSAEIVDTTGAGDAFVGGSQFFFLHTIGFSEGFNRLSFL